MQPSLRRRRKRELPELVRMDGGDGHTAILYFTHGEPPGYSAQPWIETIRELDHDKVPFVPWLIRPIFLTLLGMNISKRVEVRIINFMKLSLKI